MLKRITVLLAALSMMLMMAVPVALPAGASSCDNGKCGHQADDTLDRNQGGGDDHIKQNNGKGND